MDERLNAISHRDCSTVVVRDCFHVLGRLSSGHFSVVFLEFAACRSGVSTKRRCDQRLDKQELSVDVIG